VYECGHLEVDALAVCQDVLPINFLATFPFIFPKLDYCVFWQMLRKKEIKRESPEAFSPVSLFYATADDAVAYMFCRCFFLFFFCFFFVRKSQKYEIFMKLLPNDTGENVVCNVVSPPGEC